MHSETAAMDGRATDFGDYGLVITCEHGGNRIPRPYRDLFQAHQALLDTHRGFDPGALIMARELATAFAAPLVASTVSRLLVDLNRSIGHPRLHYEAIRKRASRGTSADIEALLPAVSRASGAFGQAGDRGPRPCDPPLVPQLYSRTGRQGTKCRYRPAL